MSAQDESRDQRTPNARRAYTWRRYLQFFGTRVDADVDDELLFHFDMLVRDYRARGMSDAHAGAEATRRIGDIAGVREQCVSIGHRRTRRAARASVVDALRQDLRFALRTLVRERAWTTVIVLTLALGIGASAAIFSVVNTIVLRPFDYPHADRVFLLWRAAPKSGLLIGADHDLARAAASVPAISDVQEYGHSKVTVIQGGEPSVVGADWIRPGLLSFAGARVIAGRTFTAAENADSTLGVAMISEGYWHAAFAQRDVLGKIITVDGRTYTIVGIVSHLRLPEQTDRIPTAIWLPYVPNGTTAPGGAMLRLRDGVSRETAEQQLAVAAKRYTPPGSSPFASFVPKLVPPGHFNGLHDSLVLLSIAVALLLVIACANAAHLLLARSASREREFAVRRALGASASRVARQLFTENGVLLLVACGVGLALARAGLSAIVAMRPPRETQLAYASLDWRVAAMAVSVTMVTGVILGALIAASAVRRDTLDSLKNAGRSSAGNPRAHRLRAGLVVTEVALSAMMLLGALLLIRSVINLQRIDPGFDAAGLYAMPFHFSPRDTRDSTARAQFARDALDAAKRAPGVTAATVANVAPPEFSVMIGQIELDNGSQPRANNQFNPVNYVARDFFATLHIPLVGGRTFDATSAERKEVVINEGMAHHFWPAENPLGRRFRFKPIPGLEPTAEWFTVVGVTPDAAVEGLASDRHGPFIYLPSETGTTSSGFTLIMRVKPGTEGAVLAALRRVSLSLDKTMSPPQPVSLATALNDSIAAQRFTMTVLSILAALAVVLAAVGLYGVISYLVTQRTREIGIRMAIGATPWHIAREVLMKGVPLSIAGLAIGLIGATWGGAAIRNSLYGVTTNDPLSVVACAALLFGVALAACAVPMHRAARVDPLIAMRAE
jgi:putative ABC transport system permease protein